LANPTLSEIIKRSQTDVKAKLDNFNPSLKNSFFNALIVASSGRFNSLYGQLSLIQQRLLLNTTDDNFTDAWGSTYGVTRLVATQSRGNAIATGNAGTTIPTGTVLISSSGTLYTSTAASTVAATNRVGVINVVSLTATITLSSHGLASGVSVTITGAGNSIFNGSFDINVIDVDNFTITLITTISDGSYGNANILVNYATVNVLSDTFAPDTVLLDGSSLSLENSIAGIDDNIYSSFGGIVGGSDIESNNNYKNRVLYRIRNPMAYSSISYIKNILFEDKNITRAWVLPATPSRGYITTYFVKDNDTISIFPTSQDLIDAKARLSIPGDIPESNFIVSSPIEKVINFNFSSFNPYTDAMKKSIDNNLSQLFKENIEIGKNLDTPNTITASQYNKAILSSIDTNTGQSLRDFLLTSPAGNISVADNELCTLGAITV
tara:strand:+ start:3907 stop:5214 length:1308 start_codon:yes stop_codon:yes gene_type:complete